MPSWFSFHFSDGSQDPQKPDGTGHFDLRATTLLVQVLGFEYFITYNLGKDNLAADDYRTILTLTQMAPLILN